MPFACAECPAYKECLGRACTAETRYVIDAAVDVQVTEHRVMELVCPYSNARIRGEFPANIKASVQYGDNLKAMVVAFNTVGAVSAKRIHEIFGGVFNIPLSTGTIANMVQQFSEALEAPYSALKLAATNMPVGHFDETGSRVDGHTKWVHVVSNDRFTFLYLDDKRGRAAMERQGVLPEFRGILVHDSLASYWQYGSGHGLCCAHILRELNGVVENHPEQAWAPSFIKLLLDRSGQRMKLSIAAENGWMPKRETNSAEGTGRSSVVRIRRTRRLRQAQNAEAGASAVAFLR